MKEHVGGISKPKIAHEQDWDGNLSNKINHFHIASLYNIRSL